MIWLFSALMAAAHAGSLLTKVASCATVKPTRTVQIIKQWHLPPKTITKGFRERYPQERNQSAIYIALADKIKNKKLDLVVAEGCEGEINQDFTTAFNGWDLTSLQKMAQTKGFDRIIAHVPLKLEARFGDKILTICGDNNRLIQEGNLRISNLRGWAGYWMRLREGGNLEKSKPYAETVADILKIPRDTPVDKIIPQVQEHMKEDLEAFKKSLADRNEQFVKVLQSHDFKQAAVVIGGLHAEDLKAKLQAAGFGCDVLQPSGYQREDENLLQDFEKALTAKAP